MKKNIKSFLQDAIINLLSHKVSTHFPRAKKIDDCSGFFDSSVMEFAVAIGKPQKEWVEIFIHEYCHFNQWEEQCDVWTAEGDNILDEWLYNKKLKLTKKIGKKLRNTQACELDCEKRVIETIKKYNLEIDVDQYIRKANSYVYMYNMVIKEKMWYGDNPPYRVKGIMDIMPDHFDNDYTVMPEGYEALVRKYCA